MSGDTNQLIEARSALLDAMEALDSHRDAVVLVGAQAIYLHTGKAPVALAEATKDSDLALDVRELSGDPLIEEAMHAGGFDRDPNGQPGAWLSAKGVPVDLMVPARMAGSGSRSVTMPPHDRFSARRASGLEAALVDCAMLTVSSLDPLDSRSADIRVAGPAALLVAKLHKLGERAEAVKSGTQSIRRLRDKDAHDIYRILVAIDGDALAAAYSDVLQAELSSAVAREALAFLSELFASGPDATGSMMAGRAEEFAGDPVEVSASVATLALELLEAVGAHETPPPTSVA